VVLHAAGAVMQTVAIAHVAVRPPPRGCRHVHDGFFEAGTRKSQHRYRDLARNLPRMGSNRVQCHLDRQRHQVCSRGK
jgi:hypothetical protein